MDSKIMDSGLRRTDIAEKPANEMVTAERKKDQGEEYRNKEIALKRKYDAVSKNGDTLELSEKGKKLGEYMRADHTVLSGEKAVLGSGKQIPESILSGYSEAKLRQLYANKEITKQQYERIMKKRKSR